jgi:hypothetical protein
MVIMKKVLCFGLVFVFVLFSAFVSFAAEYNWDEAANHIGEEATVCGKIVDTFPYSGMTILGMGAGVMEPSAVGIEVDDSMKGDLDEDLYVGKTICVTGEIHENPNGGGSIKVSDPSQIKVK